jgi:RNA polymerase sigma-70 factor (family 1)
MRIKYGDVQAFELFFRKFNVRLCVFANKFLNDPETAQEIVQDAFLRIWEGRSEIDPDDSLKSYIFKTVQNMSINKLRKKKVESKYIEIYKMVYVDQHDFSSYELHLANELEEHLEDTVSRLPRSCREIFKLSRHEGLKYSEIADILSISPKTVEAQMSKALRILRLRLNVYLKIVFIALIDLFSKFLNSSC